MGVDGSDTTLAAARSAAHLAAAAGARLHVVTAFDRHEIMPGDSRNDLDPTLSAEEARAHAARVAGELRTIVPSVTSSSALGKPQQVLVDEAERREATLIVVGNRGMQGISRLLGSVANWVAHHAPCDVLIVKPSIDNLSTRRRGTPRRHLARNRTQVLTLTYSVI